MRISATAPGSGLSPAGALHSEWNNALWGVAWPRSHLGRMGLGHCEAPRDDPARQQLASAPAPGRRCEACEQAPVGGAGAPPVGGERFLEISCASRSSDCCALSRGGGCGCLAALVGTRPGSGAQLASGNCVCGLWPSFPVCTLAGAEWASGLRRPRVGGGARTHPNGDRGKDKGRSCGTGYATHEARPRARH